MSAGQKRAVFLDRDGVLNEIVMRGATVGSPRTVDEFRLLPEAPSAVERLRKIGFEVHVVSNQPDVARGLLTADALSEMHELLCRACPVDGVHVCIHDDSDNCSCRKPKPGLILKVARERHINLSASYLIGDSWRDVGAALAAGCRPVLLRRPYNEGVVSPLEAFTLAEAVDLIAAGR